MATALQKQSLRNIGSYGLIREASVGAALIPEGAVTEVQNFKFDRLGLAMVRPGLTNIGGSIQTVGGVTGAATCVGIHNALSSIVLAATVGQGNPTIWRYMGTGSFATALSLAATNATARVRFVDFLGKTLVLTGTYESIWINTDKYYSNWSAGGAPLNTQLFESGRHAKYGEVYKSRMYLAGDSTNASRLYFSSVVSSDGNITWTPTTDYVDINPSDGEDIAGVKRYSLELLVFKPNYTYRFRTSGLDPDPLVKVGTRSQESVVEGKKGMYFHHDTGFFRYSGSYPTEISRPIIDFIEAIPFSQFANIIGWKDNDHIYWSVGNLTISEYNQNVVWKNVVLRYTESSDAWTVYSYPFDVRAAATYTSPTQQSTLVASDAQLSSGSRDSCIVATQNSGTTDCGEPIKYRVITKWYEWEGIENQKIIQTMAAVTEKGMNSELMYQVNAEMEWNGIGTLKSFLTLFQNQQIKFNRIRFKVTGTTRNEAAIFSGLEILEGVNEGLVTTAL